MRVGTSYFVSFDKAMLYYKAYYEDAKTLRIAVKEKIILREIAIGKPPLKSNEKLYLDKWEGRYHIETK